MRLLLALVAGCLLLSACDDLGPAGPLLLDEATDRLLEHAAPGLSAHRTGLPASGASRDGGGLIAERQVHVAYLAAAPEPFAVARDCRSACTLYLALAQDPETCFPADGVLRFHRPAPIEGLGTTEREATAVVLAHAAVASPELALRLALALPSLEADGWIEVPMADLIAAGRLRACG